MVRRQQPLKTHCSVEVRLLMSCKVALGPSVRDRGAGEGDAWQDRWLERFPGALQICRLYTINEKDLPSHGRCVRYGRLPQFTGQCRIIGRST